MPSKKSSSSSDNTKMSEEKFQEDIEHIEQELFKTIKTPLKRFYVETADGHKLWTLSANTSSTETPIVVVHGLCAGIGLWVHMIDKLAQANPFYAFDLPGFGRSSRPKFSENALEAEAQFVAAIDEWRREMKLEKMILLGHSFGGYLSTAYTLKHAANVQTLVLIDPWGFNENPRINSQEVSKPIWVHALSKCSQKIIPFSIVRATGPRVVPFIKYLRPDFKRKFSSVIEDPNYVYDYIYMANSLEPT